MFNMKEFIGVLTDDYMKNSKKEKYLHRTLVSDDFYGWIFNPPQEMTTEKIKEDMYKTLTCNGMLKLIINTLIDFGYDSYSRTAAVFLYSVCTYAMDLCNSETNDADEAYKRGDIGRSSRDSAYERADKRFAYVSRINELCNKIVKRDAKRVWVRTGLPKAAVTNAFKTVPEKKFLRNDKVGYYLNIVTTQLYKDIDEDDIMDFRADEDWSTFFVSLFGRDNEVQVAMFLTLEGTSRIAKNWRDMNRIRAVWDSLTGYALSVLEDAGASERSHMLDLYVKIVSSMNESNRDELRVDLRKLDEDAFPNLTRSINNIKDKLRDAAMSVKNNADETKVVTKVS